MATKHEINTIIDEEISQAKKSSNLFLICHIVLVGMTIIFGSATTLITANTFTAPEWSVPLLAAITTALGTIANQTDFRKKSNGYRISKVEFQNLKLQLVAQSDTEVDKKIIERISELRHTKVARTTDIG